MSKITCHRACSAVGALFALALFADARARADDWPQWRGPRRDGSLRRRTDLRLHVVVPHLNGDLQADIDGRDGQRHARYREQHAPELSPRKPLRGARQLQSFHVARVTQHSWCQHPGARIAEARAAHARRFLHFTVFDTQIRGRGAILPP